MKRKPESKRRFNRKAFLQYLDVRLGKAEEFAEESCRWDYLEGFEACLDAVNNWLNWDYLEGFDEEIEEEEGERP